MGEAPGARLFRLDIRIALGREEREIVLGGRVAAD